ncbi:MAG: ATP-binding protein [Sandaracinaceae bacterium]|nr:MAG: ATP-binding protein [Sandaracinaceae bacterium]
MVRIAKRNSDRLARLVDQILDAERLRSGHLSIDMAPHRPVALVEEAVEDLGQASRLEIDDTLPAEARVHVDGDRIVQVLTNLLANAFKHGPDDAPVTVRLRPGEDDAVRFEIIDRGPGIPLEDRGRLFQRFTQLDATDARAKGGSGLGLAISKALVDAHDGEVGVACPPDGGCVFWFELPSV